MKALGNASDASSHYTININDFNMLQINTSGYSGPRSVSFTSMPAKKAENSITHIRRCHVCGTVNESTNQAIHQCSDCGKHLAPFYYFDESQMQGLADNGLHLSQLKEVDRTQVETFKPLWGFSTYW